MKILIAILAVCVSLVSSNASANRDPFTYEIGKIFRHSLYDHERGINRQLFNRGHTIAQHWDQSYSDLVERCSGNNNGTFSTWDNKGVAYDRIQKTFRQNEASIVNLSQSPQIRGAVYRYFNSQHSKYGSLVRCSLPALLRFADYATSGTKRTRMVVNGRLGEVQIVTAFPAY